MESNSFVIIWVIDKIGRPRSWSLICQSRVRLQTRLDNTKSFYQLIITTTISEKKGKQINLGQTSPVVTMSKVKNLEISWFFFFRVSGCCYGYCDQLCDWWIKLSGHSMIGCFNCPIAGVRLQPTVRLQLCKLISEMYSSWCTNPIWGNCDGYD